ncbi:MAG: response regulator [Vicinamibacteria bacterium]
MRTVLEQRGASVRSAASVAEPLAAFERATPDVLVSDIGMPERDGYDLIREVRARTGERGGAVPALALTAYAALEDRKKTADAGFQEYLAKPAEPAELVNPGGAPRRTLGNGLTPGYLAGCVFSMSRKPCSVVSFRADAE